MEQDYSKVEALGGFVRPSLSSPVLTPKSDTRFYCPMHKQKIKWEESDVFNPASTVYRDKLYVLYRAEDNSATGIGKRTSRIGLAQTTDGINFRRAKRPVLYPADDAMKAFEWPCSRNPASPCRRHRPRRVRS